jgi:hypothetical protein
VLHVACCMLHVYVICYVLCVNGLNKRASHPTNFDHLFELNVQ